MQCEGGCGYFYIDPITDELICIPPQKPDDMEETSMTEAG